MAATTATYTLSLHDALPICGDDARRRGALRPRPLRHRVPAEPAPVRRHDRDRKSTRLNSSHQINSYAVFCLKKKNDSGNPAGMYVDDVSLPFGTLSPTLTPR